MTTYITNWNGLLLNLPIKPDGVIAWNWHDADKLRVNVAWNLIDTNAKADLAEYQATGNTDALERLKEKVRQLYIYCNCNKIHN